VSVDIFMVIIMENRGVNRLLIGVILVLIIILQLFTSINYAQNSLFTLVSYSYKSSSGSEYIYPGSRNIIVTVNVYIMVHHQSQYQQDVYSYQKALLLQEAIVHAHHLRHQMEQHMKQLIKEI